MLTLNFIARKGYFKLLGLGLLFILFQGCKVYEDPITVDEAANIEKKSYLKITMLNGDKYIYDAIESIGDDYYGIYYKEGEKLKTLLKTTEIKDVQYHNEKASAGNNVIGIGIGVLSLAAGILMF